MNDQLSRTDYELTIDNDARRYLNDASNWGKFLAIAGLISSALLLIGGFYLSQGTNNREYRFLTEDEKTAYQVGTIIGTIILAAILLFPNIMLLRYVNRIKKALNANSSETLTSAFKAQRNMYIYIGILMILWLLLALLGVAGGAFESKERF